MGYPRMVRAVVLMLPGVISSSAAAQSAAAPVKKTGVTWRQMNIRFSGGKALVGMPEVTALRQRSCATDGTSYFDLTSDDIAKPPELYSVATDGIVKHIRRTLPQDYTSISISDFYPTDRELVSLVRTGKSDLNYSNSREEVTYWISLTEHDGSGSGKLLQLDLKFKPLKVALFGSGEFVVLGWDEANLLPVLVVLKDDGTPRRFLDLESRKPNAPVEVQDAYSGSGSSKAQAALAALSNAKFVPFDGRALLTYPGTARGVQVLTPLGVAWTIPIALPSGFLLHDVLVSTSRYSLVLRAQAAEDFAEHRPPEDLAAEKPKQRVFEMHVNTGALLREFLFETPHPQALTCAANNKLTAVFDEPVADPDAAPNPAANASEKPAEPPMHRVVASVRW